MAMAHMAKNSIRFYEKGLIIMLFNYSYQLAYKVLIYVVLLSLSLTPFYKTKNWTLGLIASLRLYY